MCPSVFIGKMTTDVWGKSCSQKAASRAGIAFARKHNEIVNNQPKRKGGPAL